MIVIVHGASTFSSGPAIVVRYAIGTPMGMFPSMRVLSSVVVPDQEESSRKRGSRDLRSALGIRGFPRTM